MSIARVALAAVLVAMATPVCAQNLVRVTDPTNPVVTDAYESGGGTWVDLVGDGQLDLFVPHGNLSVQPSGLYRNTRAGSFVRVVTGPVATNAGSSIGGTVGDFDNDGFPDLFVTNRNNFGNFLYRGLGDTLFTRITTGPPATDVANSNSSSWVDLDHDGLLDLYTVNFQGNDFLYVNQGGPAFDFVRVDTTAATPGSEFSINGVWADYNGDGLDDFFVGNAGTQNDYLYTNHGGLFFTRTVLADARSTLGASWGDYDNDGWPDLFVANYQNQKCILYHNSGPPAFALVRQDTSAVASSSGFWVGSAWGDYDNDGYLDLVVASDGAAAMLFHNAGPPGYGLTRVTTGSIATDVGNAFGCAWGDYDRDGNLDLFVAHRANQTDFLYHNLGGTSNHWLTVRCRGTVSNRSAIGAQIRVWATIGGAWTGQWREVTSQTGYNSGNLDQHFGLGDAAVIDSIRVRWPSGRSDLWMGVPADTMVFLTEGTSPLAVGDGRAANANGLALAITSRNPSAGDVTLRATLPRNGTARVDVFDVSGRHFATPWRGSDAGTHAVRFAPPATMGAGLYFCRLTQGTRVSTATLVRLR